MLEVLAAGALAAAVLWFVTGDADVTQISDGRGHVLLGNGQWNVEPATMVPGVRPMPALGGLGRKTLPAFVSNRQDALTHTITGNASGNYDLTWMGGGVVATLAAVATTAGAVDTAVITQGKTSFTAANEKALTATLLGGVSASRLPRTATLKTTASAGAALTVSFDPVAETFEYLHEGAPTSYTLELSSLDTQGRAMTFAAPAAFVAKGDTLTFKPDWNQLAEGGGAVIVRTATGSVSSRTLK
jgi:hypothetical protein